MDKDIIKEIIRGTLLSFENGFALFDAAELLYRKRFYSISVALCVLSIEELGKTHIISRSLYLDENNKRERNKWYYKKFRNHINKSGAAIYGYKYIKDLIKKDIISEENELDALMNAQISNKIKEIGIYVDVDSEGNFYSPKEIVNKELAYGYLEYTSEIVKDYYCRYEKTKNVNTDILIAYYEEMISLGKKYEVGKIQDEKTYSSENIEKLKKFKNEAQKIAVKYNLWV